MLIKIGEIVDSVQIKRNVLRFMGFNLPDQMLDDVRDIKVVGDNFQLTTKAKINLKDWKFVYGSCE